ncbi:MAG TPA: hypothetical protein DEB40_13785 [Elusimicrobia bacterium]|nr:hypothetical protein [Elusimicrobiota bacterium]HBT62804.1 hypothetical protein [Elusimicrobiota bacterium]
MSNNHVFSALRGPTACWMRARRQASGWALIGGLILAGPGLARGQMIPPPQSPASSPFTSPSKEREVMQEAMEDAIKEEMPELREFQERLQALEAKILEVAKLLAHEEIDQDAAREQLLPLVKERHEIENDPSYLVEKELSRALFSSPTNRKKIEDKMRIIRARKNKKSRPSGASMPGPASP